MSDFKTTLSFDACWKPKKRKKAAKPTGGGFNAGLLDSNNGGGRGATPNAISGSDKARLMRVVRKAPEVFVKVTQPAKLDTSGNKIQVSRQTEGARVASHLEYISRNGKVSLESESGIALEGKDAVSYLTKDWLEKHDEDYSNRLASDRTRITTSLVLSMPEETNSGAVRDAVRAVASQEFGRNYEYVMALHTDTPRPHVHLTLRTVGHDGQKLNLRKADLQHIRDVFAEKLRQRGIEAESTPRYARGVTRKGERTAIRKMRERGAKVYTDEAKRHEVEKDLERSGGRSKTMPWDNSIVDHRSEVIRTYNIAADILSQSDDIEDKKNAKQVREYSASLLNVETERLSMARDVQKTNQKSGLNQAQKDHREANQAEKGIERDEGQER